MRPERYTLCVHLRRWPIDRALRRRPGLRREPFVLVGTTGGREVVAHAGPGTPAGVRVGATLAEARACCPSLAHLPATPAEDDRALEALARWLVRFSPDVAVCRPDAIYLDATGLERLAGDLPAVCRAVAGAVAALRLAAGVAAAPTPGAAWALAAFGRGTPCVVTDRGAIVPAVSPLPVRRLRLDAGVLAALGALGVGTVGACWRRARDDVAVRFGPATLRRVDEVTGAAAEPLAFLEHRGPVRASIEFDGAVGSPEAIHLVLRQLVVDVAAELARRGHGAGAAADAPAAVRAAGADPRWSSRPSRTVKTWFDLLRHAAQEAGDVGGGGGGAGADAGFLAVGLDVTRSEPLAEAQAELSGGEGRPGASEVDDLVDRLRARLGPAVEWVELVESRTPERAFRPSGARPAIAAAAPCRARPLRLLREPREVLVTVTPSENHDGRPVSFTDAGRVCRLARARGPERVAGEWWDGRWKTRDYFDAEDEAGRRVWLFRVAETNRWYLHGLFE